MSDCLRYRNPAICDHLASQYVVGSVSVLVRSRIETLRAETPELDRAIAFYADKFSDIPYQLNESVLSDHSLGVVWNKVEQQLAHMDAEAYTNDERINKENDGSKAGFWNRLLVWQVSSGVGALASCVLAVMLWVSSPTISPVSTLAGPSYLANMFLHGSDDTAAQFIISAYKKNDNTPSRLHIQWSLDNQDRIKQGLHLWAEDKVSGKLTYIGIQPGDDHWDLDKASWQAVANSGRLLMTNSQQSPIADNIVFSGLCLQLEQWQS